MMIVEYIKNQIFFTLIQKKKKVVDKKKILNEFFIFDLILIGFNDGLKVISKDMTKVFLKERKQKPIFFVDVGLPGNVDPEISKISNCYLFDLNDLEQFFSLFFGENNMGKFDDHEKFYLQEDKIYSHFFKRLNFNENQKKIFKNYIEDFLFKNNEKNLRETLLKFLKTFKQFYGNQETKKHTGKV